MSKIIGRGEFSKKCEEGAIYLKIKTKKERTRPTQERQ
jgi:hypothetical protein